MAAGQPRVVSSTLSALPEMGVGRQQLLQQHLLITMPAASPFRRPGQPKTCLFGSKMVRCRAQRRGQRTLGRFHDFSRSLSGWGLLTTVFRPQPCRLASLRMGITQYNEVSAVDNVYNVVRR